MAPVADTSRRSTDPVADAFVAKLAGRRFLKAYSTVRDQLLDNFNAHRMPLEVLEHYKRVMDYNVPEGSLARGLRVMDTVAILKGHELAKKEYNRAAVLGWSVEFFHTHFDIFDDIIDNSHTRNGKPCWFRLEGIGMTGINDGLLIEGAIYHMLRWNIARNPGDILYIDILDILHDVSFKSEMGQCVELTAVSNGNLDLSKFTMERYNLITVHKNVIPSYYLPVALGLLFCGFSLDEAAHSPDRDVFKISEGILIELGKYAQVKSDYLEYLHAGKNGNLSGRNKNKVTWCIVTALKAASPEQRTVLENSYGRNDAVAEARVREAFRAIDLTSLYLKYEREAREKVGGLIDAMPEVQSSTSGAVLRREVFRSLLCKIDEWPTF